MQQQFIEVAASLDWDLNTQIEQLDEFVRVYGAAGRLDAELAEIGLSLQQRLHREALRDAIMRFIERLGAAGAFSHYLHAQMRAQAHVLERVENTSVKSSVVQSPARLMASQKPRRLRGIFQRWLPGQVRDKTHGVAP
ncbi:MAG: hypothetical protein RI539_04845 [Spiribacter sp.]|nr:hypothetical protein [Spiribacter sp.]MDR9489657.1 hypothetical protein [Spiribacter sp.]